MAAYKQNFAAGWVRYKFSVLLSAIFLLITAYATWWFEVGYWLKFVPQQMHVLRVTYAKTKDDASLPWVRVEREAGIVAFEMPDTTQRAILKGGLSYFAQLPQGNGTGDENRHGLYSDWSATPVPVDGRWSGGEGAHTVEPAYRIQNYLNTYGFGIQLDPTVEHDVDEAVSTPGNYFAYGRNNIIIVAPAQHRVYFAFVK